jgi:hypothetical protein
MNKQKQKLILALQTLAETMDEVDANGGELNMGNWVCGDAACVCGWQAMKNNTKVFHKVADAGDIPYYADNISETLDELCRNVFNNTYLSQSIWDVWGENRVTEALDSNLFTKEELLHPHLTDNTTAKDAADYLRLCIKKVEEYQS